MASRTYSNFRCARCDRRLRYDVAEDGTRRQRWLRSEWTGNRYCWPTDCNAVKKLERRDA